MLNCPNCAEPVYPEQCEEYRPISTWSFLGYELLFMIPVLGFIVALSFASGHKNPNVRSFARSYFCLLGFALLGGLAVCTLLGAAVLLDSIF